jgi:sugar/nucleoside kinase (ribokinase family)
VSLLVVGSVAFDTVETPAHKAETVLGGSAVYFSAAAHRYTPVRLVGVVGEDFPDEHREFLTSMDVDIAGLVTQPGETFRWHGKYQGAMNEAETVSVDLNVFGSFDPVVPEDFRDSTYVFLANGVPAVQMKVLDQVESPKLVVADTMNLWIETQREALDQLIGRIDVLCLNENEARMLTGHHGLARAARSLVEMGLKAAVIKKGEHGMTLATPEGVRALPAYPVEEVLDPTGAGDSFAGAMMGDLARYGNVETSGLMQAAASGIAMASFTVGGFGPEHIARISLEDVEARVEELRKICSF